MTLTTLKDMIKQNEQSNAKTVNAVRFIKNGSCLVLEDGSLMKKGINVIHQIHYWNKFTKDQCKEIAKFHGARAIISLEENTIRININN